MTRENGLHPKSETQTERVVVSFKENRIASLVFGEYDKNLAHLERKLSIHAHANGNHVTLDGTASATEQARKILETLYQRASMGEQLSVGDIDGVIEEMAFQGSLFPDTKSKEKGFSEITTRKKGVVRARTPAQDTYLRALKASEMVMVEGPAGSGKTWLAVGHAVMLLEQGAVERIILSRPAVEAGERLGFLPGDMKEKVDPYLRPIYDALYDFMDARSVERALQTGLIEIAPLAFMRGRTLSKAAVLLDEAQNCSSMQMKMFLTRLGEGSRMIVVGDATQTDLPRGENSGLRDAFNTLHNVEGISFIRLTDVDVVRHDLVRRIVTAYAEKEASMN